MYNTANTTAPPSNIPVIDNAKDTGILGSIKLRLLKVKHAVVYELRYTKDDNPTTAT